MAVPGVPLVREGDDLAGILLDCMGRAGMSLQDGDVLVLCQKIVSKAEGRVVQLD
ncbi:MAG: coenzyme F420-0:L-glutamate ligase, partial [Delftia sp.]|nr:coenzyme F420-0:L-glutamate ligase [Delftia sp.]